MEPYRPGEFFRRELPAPAAVLAAAGPVDLLVVDGYVDAAELVRAMAGPHRLPDALRLVDRLTRHPPQRPER